MDYGKYKFEQTKREKEARKNQHVVEIKEVRMSPGIDVNDFNVKLRNAQKFLAEGNRVKVTVRFRGREMAHTDIGKSACWKSSQSDCGEVADHGQGAQAGWTSHDHVPVLPVSTRRPRKPNNQLNKGVLPPCLRSRLKPTAARRRDSA
ncbi:MAG: translation initiation factor IF-3 [Flavonifractor plautii]